MVYGPLIHLSPVIKYEQKPTSGSVSRTIIQLKRAFGFTWDWFSKYSNGSRVNVKWLSRQVNM